MLFALQTSDFAGDGHLKLSMKLGDHRDDEVLLLEEVRAVVAFACDALGAAQVDVNRVAIVLNEFSRLEQVLGVVGAELDEEGPVLGLGVEVLLPVLGVGRENLRVEHGRVAELGAVVPGEHPEGQLGLIDHGRNHELGAADFLV